MILTWSTEGVVIFLHTDLVMFKGYRHRIWPATWRKLLVVLNAAYFQ